MNKYTWAEKDELIRRRSEGATFRELAQDYGVSITRIVQVIELHKIDREKRRRKLLGGTNF